MIPPVREAPDTPPAGKPKIVILKLPQEAGAETWLLAADWAYGHYRRTTTASHDDMLTMLAGGNAESYALIVEPDQPSQAEAIRLLEAGGYRWEPLALDEELPPPSIRLTYRPCQTTVVTQAFGANPEDYAPFGLPGHEGLDFAVAAGGDYYAAAGGVVVHASDRKWSSDQASAYGWHVVIEHEGFWTVYAHAAAPLPVAVGQAVTAGQVVGRSGNTGNSTGYHLHFGVGAPGDTGNGYPLWRYGQPVDPAPFLRGLSAPPAAA